MISQSHKNFNSGELIRLYPSLIVQKYTYELPIAPGCIYTYKVKILQENQTKQIIIGEKKIRKMTIFCSCFQSLLYPIL